VRPRRSGPRSRSSTVQAPSALTAAELRLLPLLSARLSFPEEMFLSRNTIKSQAMSIYRKLGASHEARQSPGPVS
jgi:DNA-binding CsgD family transcriptional regulator